MVNWIDNHIPNLKNWWEGEPSMPKSKKSARQKAKKDIQEELTD
jgi:hypothetical protein